MTPVLPDWPMLIGELSHYVVEGVKAERSLLWSRWYIGRGLIEYHSRHDHLGEYGDKIAERAAADLKLSRSLVYECVRFGRKYPTIESVTGLIDSGVNTWSDVLKCLPDYVTDPSVNGRERANNALSVAEWSRNRLRRYIESGVPEEQREEVIGHLTEVVKEDFSLLRMLEPAAVVHIDPEIVQTSGQLTPGDEKAFMAWVRLHPCIVCGQDHNTAEMHFHHFPSTKGAGGEDWRGIPLCGVCHSEAHSMGITEFQRWHGEAVTMWMQSNLFEAVISDMKKGGD